MSDALQLFFLSVPDCFEFVSLTFFSPYLAAERRAQLNRSRSRSGLVGGALTSRELSR